MSDDWVIDNDEAANWALGRLAAAEAELDALAEQRAAQVAILDRWVKTRSARPARRQEMMVDKLKDYAAGRVAAQLGERPAEDDGVWKSVVKRVSCPLGYVQARRQVAGVRPVGGVVAARAYNEAWLTRFVTYVSDDTAVVVASFVDALSAAGAKVDWGAPLPSPDEVRVTDDGRVVWADTGEFVPGVVWRAGGVVIDDPRPVRGAEHPVWSVPPDGSGIPSDIEDLPDDGEDA